MDIINQTNRSILLDEINPNQLDLLTILNNTNQAENLDDLKILEINDKLLVHSFHEFITKFHPAIYEVYDRAKKNIRYFIKKPEGIPKDYIQVIEIDEKNEFLNLLESLVFSSNNLKKIQPEFHFKYILDYLSPRLKIDFIKEKRNTLVHLVVDYLRQKSERIKERQLNEIKIRLDEIVKESHSIMVILPIALDNIKSQLMSMETSSKSYDPITLGVLQMEEGDVHIVESPEFAELPVSALGEKEKILLKEIISESIKRNSLFQSTEVQKIFYYFFGFHDEIDKYDLNTTVTLYNSYLELYKQAKEGFLITAKPFIEKILGVKLFFNQYLDHEKGMGMSLIVTNVKNSKWMKPDYKKRLQAYLTTVNTKIAYENTIWFAILPPIPINEEKSVDIRRERFKGNRRKEKGKGNWVEETICMMELLSQYFIHTFFSLETGRETTFSHVGENGVTRVIEACKPFMKKEFSRYMVPSFPNFTIIPKEHSYIIVGRKLYITEENTVCVSKKEEDLLKIWIGGIYVEASYIAAGLMSACQCPVYLKHCFGKNVEEGFPGVHYNIEQSNNSEYTLTTMAKEVPGFKEEVLEEINAKKFGYMFSSEKNSRISVFHARNLAVKKDQYECIYETLAITYIIRILQYETYDFRKDEIKRFFQNDPESRRGKWLNGRRFINPILGMDDNLSFSFNEEKGLCILEFTVKGQKEEIGIEIKKLAASKREENIDGSNNI